MNQYLALNEKALKRLSYHAIWGLQADVIGRKSLYQLAYDLHQNPREMAKLIQTQTYISQYPGILGIFIRSFSWIFNWNQYRVNYHILQAYGSWIIYQEGINMLSKNQKRRSESDNGFLIKNTESSTYTIQNMFNGPLYGMKQISDALGNAFASISWVGSSLLNTITGEQQLIEVPLKIEKTHFTVHETMLTKLETLGINAAIGQQIAFDK